MSGSHSCSGMQMRDPTKQLLQLDYNHLAIINLVLTSLPYLESEKKYFSTSSTFIKSSSWLDFKHNQKENQKLACELVEEYKPSYNECGFGGHIHVHSLVKNIA